MSDTLIIGLAVGLLTMIGNLIVSILNHKETSAQTVKIDEQAIKTAEIHTATNGTLTALTKTLEVANQEIKGLKDLIAEMNASKKDAKDLADKAP